MPSKHLIVGIDWCGPYRSLEAARKAASDHYKGGLYLCLGKQKGQHQTHPQYVGKSNKNLSTRLQKDHKKIDLVKREQVFWLGEVVTGGVPGRATTHTPPSVRFSEWAIAYFMQLPLNEKLRINPPKRPVTVLSWWWHRDHETPFKQRPHAAWPDLIDYLDEEGLFARSVQFGAAGKIHRHERP